MKVCELSGPQLDYWVAKAEGWTFGPPHKIFGWDVWRDSSGEITGTIPAQAYNPSSDWAQGGPLIEKYDVEIEKMSTDWMASMSYKTGALITVDGSTPLQAICRAVVFSKFGNEVEDGVGE